MAKSTRLTQIDEKLKSLATAPQLQTMVAVLIHAGLRRQELLWLTRDDMDWTTGPNGMIRVRAKTIAGETWQPKTKANRAVSISSILCGSLDICRPRIAAEGRYFPSPGVKRPDPNNFSQDLRHANGKTHFSWGCLDFRRTFGSHFAVNGGSLYKISALMGNTPDICRRHYASLNFEEFSHSEEFATVAAREVATP